MIQEKPLLKQGWARAMLFVISILAIMFLTTMITNRLTGNINQAGSGIEDSTATGNGLTGWLLLVKAFISTVILFTTVYYFRKLIDKQTFLSLGLPIKNYLPHAATGFFLAILLLGIGTFILIAANNLLWTGFVFDAKHIFIGFVLMACTAFIEELMFRGYILNNMMQSMNKWMALLFSALIFAFFHASNPGITPLAIGNVFLAGILIGINYLFTKNLWFGILFHFSWNFYQGAILGYKVSGVPLESILHQNLKGNALLTGGTFGFEGSLINSLLSIAGILVLAWVYRKRFEG